MRWLTQGHPHHRLLSERHHRLGSVEVRSGTTRTDEQTVRSVHHLLPRVGEAGTALVTDKGEPAVRHERELDEVVLELERHWGDAGLEVQLDQRLYTSLGS